MRFSKTFCRATIATGTIIPPPGDHTKPLEHILAWLAAAGAILVALGLLGTLYGS